MTEIPGNGTATDSERYRVSASNGGAPAYASLESGVQKEGAPQSQPRKELIPPKAHRRQGGDRAEDADHGDDRDTNGDHETEDADHGDDGDTNGDHDEHGRGSW